MFRKVREIGEAAQKRIDEAFEKKRKWIFLYCFGCSLLTFLYFYSFPLSTHGSYSSYIICWTIILSVIILITCLSNIGIKKGQYEHYIVRLIINHIR